MALFLSPALVISPESQDTYRPLIGWHNLVTIANVSADGELATDPATNMANPSTPQMWIGDGIVEHLVTVINLTGEIDNVSFARHNFGSSGSTVAVEGVNSESDPDYEELVSVMPQDDKPLMLKFARDEYTSIRVRITPGDAAPQAAVMFVGLLLSMPVGITPGFTPPSKGTEIDRAANWSESGEFLGAIVTGSRLTSRPQFADIDPDSYNDDVAPFVTAANFGAPFFFAWSPYDDPNDVSYCWLASSAIPVINRKTGYHDLTLNIGGTNL